MEGLLPATASTFQLILEHLGGVLLVVSESLRHVPGPPVVPWGILVGALVVVSLIVKRRHASRSVKAPGKRCSARDQVCARCSENRGPVTEAHGSPKSPGVEASPLLLQTPCLRAPNKRLSRVALQDTADFLERAGKSQPPNLPQVTDGEPSSKASGIEGEPLQKNVMDASNKNTRHPESPELLQEEMMGGKQKMREQEGGEPRLERREAGKEQVPGEGGSRAMSAAGAPLPAVPTPDGLGDDADEGTLAFPQRREAENGERLVHGPEVYLKGVPHDADVNVSPPGADRENRELARQLLEQKQRNQELVAEIMALRTEKASLQRENSDLKDEAQQLKLQVPPDAHEDDVTQLQKKLFEEETRGFELEKKFFNAWRNMSSNYQLLNMYKKMIQDMDQELRRSSLYYENEIRCHQRRAEAACVAAKVTERKLEDLRRENDLNRQMLAELKSQPKLQPFPGGPLAPAAPPAARRGPEVPGRPLDQWVPGQKVTQ